MYIQSTSNCMPHSQAFEGRKEGLLLTDARARIIGYFSEKYPEYYNYRQTIHVHKAIYAM